MGVTQRSDGALVVTAVQKHSPAESTGVHPGCISAQTEKLIESAPGGVESRF